MSEEYVYGLRTCSADMTSYGGFQWPRKAGLKRRIGTQVQFAAADFTSLEMEKETLGC